MGLVTTVASSVRTEENLQVASFTYSHMKSLSRTHSSVYVNSLISVCQVNMHTLSHMRSSLLCFHYSSEACRVAMKILGSKLDRLSYRFSRVVHADIYNSMTLIN